MDTEQYMATNGFNVEEVAANSPLISESEFHPVKYSAEQIMAVIDASDEIKSGQITIDDVVARYDTRPDEPAHSQHKQAKPLALVKRVVRKVKSFGDHIRNRAQLPPTQPHIVGGPEQVNDFTPYPPVAAGMKFLSDQEANSAFLMDGYTTFSFLTADEIDDLAMRIDASAKELDRDDVHIPTRFQLSAFNNDAAYKERVFDNVWDALRSKIEAILPGYEPLVVNVFDKPASEAYDPVPIHQNPSFVAEPEHKSVSLWIPLCDVGKDNGTVGVLPGSHNRFNRMRAGNMEHKDVFANVGRKLENEAFVPVVMSKGEILALDDSILHWSYPNVSDTRRLAVQLIMVPSAAKHIYYFYDDECEGHPMMDLYEVDRNFFFGFNCKARPETLTHIDRVPYHYRPFTEEEVFGETAH
jgi:hypothetical protein